MPVLIILFAVLALGLVSLMLIGLTLKLVWMLLIGLIVGGLARLIMPAGSFHLGTTLLLGLGGSILATILGKVLNIYQPGQSAGFLGSIVGAVLILFLYRVFGKKQLSQ
jgi:uncharacterized membrane protein YeaQ/YmgE (transglycosylase-associated protein family)